MGTQRPIHPTRKHQNQRHKIPSQPQKQRSINKMINIINTLLFLHRENPIYTPQGSNMFKQARRKHASARAWGGETKNNSLTTTTTPNLPPLPKYKCLRCGHTWTPRKQNPERCPKCNSPYWNKPRKKVKPK